jgi:hypothetical protein
MHLFDRGLDPYPMMRIGRIIRRLQADSDAIDAAGTHQLTFTGVSCSAPPVMQPGRIMRRSQAATSSLPMMRPVRISR